MFVIIGLEIVPGVSESSGTKLAPLIGKRPRHRRPSPRPFIGTWFEDTIAGPIIR